MPQRFDWSPFERELSAMRANLVEYRKQVRAIRSDARLTDRERARQLRRPREELDGHNGRRIRTIRELVEAHCTEALKPRPQLSAEGWAQVQAEATLLEVARLVPAPSRLTRPS